MLFTGLRYLEMLQFKSLLPKGQHPFYPTPYSQSLAMSLPAVQLFQSASRILQEESKKPTVRSQRATHTSHRTSSSPGGHSHVRGIRVCAAFKTPFSGSSATPETHFFTLGVSSYAFQFPFLKNSAFLDPFYSDFGKISAPNTLILVKSCSKDHSFLRKKKICSVDPTFENLCGIYPPKKKKN